MDKIQRSLNYIQADNKTVITANFQKSEEEEETLVKGYDVYAQLKDQTVQSKA